MASNTESERRMHLTHAASPILPAIKAPTNHPARKATVVILGEFCGTFLFLFLSFIGAQTAIEANNANDLSAPLEPQSLLYIAASFGTAVTVNVWIFYRVTGGMFNPAVTLGLVLAGIVPPLRGVVVFITQLIAAIAAAAVVDAILPGPLLVANSLGGNANVAQGFFIEFFLTAQLVLTVYFLAVEKHRATFLAPIGIGMSVFISHVVATRWTGTGINPARSFGPAVITSFVPYHWIYWIAPLSGAVLAFIIYKLFKWLEYEDVNPGQDEDDIERSTSRYPHFIKPPIMHHRRHGGHSIQSSNYSNEQTIRSPSTTHEQPASRHATNEKTSDELRRH